MYRNLSNKALELEEMDLDHENFLSVRGPSMRLRLEIRLLNLLLKIKLYEGPCRSDLFLIRLKSPKTNHAGGPKDGIDLNSSKNCLLREERTGP